MYTSLKNYQIVIAQLKARGIRHLVLSAGSRNVPFVQSVENDPFFTCYSVVDERSAGYFALGLSTKLDEPVVLSCTSSTATCNYFPAIAEAYYQGVELVALTSDRNPMMLGQREDQMIDQRGMYDPLVRKSVNLPIVKTDEEFWYCNRLVNEALNELNHRGKGPVQINVPSSAYSVRCTEDSLPDVVEIQLLKDYGMEDAWIAAEKKLSEASKVMLVVGQMSKVSSELRSLIEKFADRYNVVVMAELMSNLRMKDAINPFLPFSSRTMSSSTFDRYVPEVVISFGGNIVSGLKEHLRDYSGPLEHWCISESGEINDMFKSLSTTFECSPEEFLAKMLGLCNEGKRKRSNYVEVCRKRATSMVFPGKLSFSNATAVRCLSERIQAGANVHLSINNSIRLLNYCAPHLDANVYSNIGTFGIDGCMSSFIGQAAASADDVPNYLIIGDLSFFYDMNSLRFHPMPRNTRIFLLNNCGGAEFYYNTGKDADPTIDLHTSARHTDSGREWSESMGFKYLSAADASALEQGIKEFTAVEIGQPIVFEVFTEMSVDADVAVAIESANRVETPKESLVRSGKEFVKRNASPRVLGALSRRL